MLQCDRMSRKRSRIAQAFNVRSTRSLPLTGSVPAMIAFGISKGSLTNADEWKETTGAELEC